MQIMQVHLYHTAASYGYSSAWWYRNDDYHQNQGLNMISNTMLAKSGLRLGGGHLKMYSTKSEKPKIYSLPTHMCRYYATLSPVTQVGMFNLECP